MRSNRKVVDHDRQRVDQEANVLRARTDKIEGKVQYLRDLIAYGEKNQIDFVSLKV